MLKRVLKGLSIVEIILLLSAQPVKAQGDFPPLVDPARIFANGVTIVDTRPILNVDNNARVLYFLDQARSAWIRVKYPAGLENVEDQRRRSDRSYILSSNVISEDQPADTLWNFDPVTETISRPETRCGVLRALKGEGEWILYQSSTTGPVRLCFTEDGTVSPPLPDVAQSNMCLGVELRPVSLSPDRKWAVFSDCNYRSFSLYSYELSTERFSLIGRENENDNAYLHVGVIRWADNIHPIIHATDDPSHAVNSLYIADVTREQSMTTIVSEDIYFTSPLAYYYDDPPRYEWVPDEFTASFGPEFDPDDKQAAERARERCQVHEFDLTTRETKIYPYIADVCGLGLLIPDATGDRLFRSIKISENTTATLIRYNFRTGSAEKLLTDKIGWVAGLSPDGRYAVLQFVVASQYIRSDRDVLDHDPFFSEHSRWVVFDLVSRKTIYETKDIKLGPWGPADWGLYPAIFWLGPDKFVVIDAGCETCSFSVALVKIHDDTNQEFPIGSAQDVHIDNKRLLLQLLNQDNSLSLEFYDVNNMHRVTIVSGLSADKFRLDTTLLENDTLEVKVIDNGANQPVLGDWLVRITNQPR